MVKLIAQLIVINFTKFYIKNFHLKFRQIVNESYLKEQQCNYLFLMNKDIKRM